MDTAKYLQISLKNCERFQIFPQMPGAAQNLKGYFPGIEKLIHFAAKAIVLTKSRQFGGVKLR